LITDDEVMRVLEQANPASVDDPIAMLDVGVYRDVLDARNMTVTLIDSEPTPSEPSGGRRWLMLVAAAAAVVLVATIALVVTGEDDATPADQPSSTVNLPTPTPPRSVTGWVSPPLGEQIECEPEACPWSPELTAHALEPPVACDGTSTYGFDCHVAVSPDGTLVFFDSVAGTLTWYEDQPRVVPVAADLTRGDGLLMAIGPHDVAYILFPRTTIVAIAPSGAEITRMAWEPNRAAYPTPTGLKATPMEWPQNPAPTMPWVDLAGNSITDTRSYPTATASDSGIEVRLGEREWFVEEVPDGPGRLLIVDFQPRSDGGVVMWLAGANPDGPDGVEQVDLLELLPDGTIERYSATTVRGSPTILPDGSLIVAHDLQLVRLSPPVGGDVTPADQPSRTVTAPPTLPPQPLPDAQGGLEPGTYYVDEVSGTPTPRIFATVGTGWSKFGEPGWDMVTGDTGTMSFDRPDAVFSDACHPSSGYHPPVTTLDGLVAALTEQQGWAEVTAPTDISIDGYAGKAFQRTVPADLSDCDTTDRRGRIEFPDDGVVGWVDFRSWVDGDGDGGGGYYYEPGGIETVWVIDLDGTLVVISTQLWWGPTAAANADFAAAELDSIRIAAWSPELVARPLEDPIASRCSTHPDCGDVAVSSDGTLVAFDEIGQTLTWYGDKPHVVPLTIGPSILMAIGPHDIAYFHTPSSFVAVAPSGGEITRIPWSSNRPVYPTATGLVPIAMGWPASSTLPVMPWVDLEGTPISDTAPYPTAKATDAGIEVRLGEREWLLAGEGTEPGMFDFLNLRPRSDGGVVMVRETVPGADKGNLLELLPDGSIERYWVDLRWSSLLLQTVLPDGSMIIEHDHQLIRLTPPT
jgi:hypothetical protein